MLRSEIASFLICCEERSNPSNWVVLLILKEGRWGPVIGTRGPEDGSLLDSARKHLVNVTGLNHEDITVVRSGVPWKGTLPFLFKVVDREKVKCSTTIAWVEPYDIIRGLLKQQPVLEDTPELLSAVYLPERAEEIIDTIQRIKDLGASALTKVALEMFETFIQAHVECIHSSSTEAGNSHGLIPMRSMELSRLVHHISSILTLIAFSKPSMASLTNATIYAIQGLQKSLAEEAEPTEMIGQLLSLLSTYYCWETEAALRTAQNTADLLAGLPTGTVMVFSNSSMVENAIVTACRNRNVDNPLTVIVFAPFNDEKANKMVERLRQGVEPEPETIKVSLIVKDEINEAMAGVDCCLVGADAVFEDGTFVNEAGTNMFALAAFNAKPSVPVRIVCRSDKIMKKSDLVNSEDITFSCEGVSPANNGNIPTVFLKTGMVGIDEQQYLECVGHDLVDCYMTELGPISQSKIGELAKRPLIQVFNRK